MSKINLNNTNIIYIQSGEDGIIDKLYQLGFGPNFQFVNLVLDK